jgi:predicted permease
VIVSWSRFFRRGAWDAERAREIDAHLAHEIDENVARGMTAIEARAAAHRKFGNTAAVREQIYEFNSIGWLEVLRLDVRDAARQLTRRRGSTILSVLLLAVGIGVSTAAFGIWYGVLWRPLAFPESGRLVTIWSGVGGRAEQISYPDLRDVRALPVFDRVGAIAGGRGTLMVGTDVERVTLADVEPAVLPLLGARPLLGRLPTADDAGHHVATISHRLWMRVLHADPAIVGRSLQISGTSMTVLGVLAEDPPFELPVGGAEIGVAFTVKDVDLWTPLDPSDPLAQRRSITTYEALARLAPGTSIASAQSAVDAVASNLAVTFPDTNRDRAFRLIGLRNQVIAARRTVIRLGAAGAALVLVIACANATGLTLGTLPFRRRDAALRAALGASRGRLLRQAVWESVLVAAVAGAAGVVMASDLVRFVRAAVPLPRADAMRFDGPVVLFAVGAALVSAVAARVVPLLGLDAGPAGLRASVSQHSASAPRFRRALVVGQLAMATIACATAALLAASLLALARIDPGFARDQTLSARVSAYPAAHPGKADVVRFYRDLLDSLRTEPGVTAAGAGTSLPLTESNTGTRVLPEGVALPEEQRPAAGWQAVSPGYFAAMGMPLRAGRDFTVDDLARSAHHVVVNESLARLLFGGSDPIGRRIALGPQGSAIDWHEIVGVVGDVRHAALTQPLGPRAYDLFGEHWARTMYVVVRGTGDVGVTDTMLREAVRRLDASAPVFEVRTLEALVSGAAGGARAATSFAIAVGVVSLVLALFGVYGLLASAVASRTRELGIRRALGASRGRLARSVAAEAAAMSAAGVVAGVTGIALFARVLESQLYGVSATNGAVVGGAAALLVAAAIVAALPPAMRAAAVDPAVTLRVE